jgi:hypothetical protein
MMHLEKGRKAWNAGKIVHVEVVRGGRVPNVFPTLALIPGTVPLIYAPAQ